MRPSTAYIAAALPHITMAVALPPQAAWPCPENNCHSATMKHQCFTLSELKSEHGEDALESVQVMANKSMRFDTPAKHSPINRNKHAAVPPILVKKFENKFQECPKKVIHFFVYLQLHFQST